MALLTGLALTLVSFTPAPQEPLTVLKAPDVKSLNSKVKSWFDVWLERELAPDTAARRRLQTKFQRAKDSFTRDWDNKEKKAKVDDLMKYVADLELIFDKAFPYGRQSTSGDVKRIKPKNSEVPEYDLAPPRGYRERESYRTIVVIPGYDGGEWEAGDDYFDKTWKGSKIVSESIFMLPVLDNSMDLDPVPDFTQPGGLETENARNAAMFLPLSDLQQTFRMDRSRLILDCGRESSGWGLRFASYSPSRFAGLILRSPVDVGDLRLGSLTGMPVLLLKAPGNTDVDAIANTLNELEAGSATVIEVADDYPHPSAQDDIDIWASGVERDLFRTKVVLTPNSDMWNDGYWVRMGEAEQISLLAEADKPRLEVIADRQANRIVVTAKSVSSFDLLLNDALVDLDKEFTVVVNGTATTQRRGRSMNTMAEGVFRSFDPSWIFTTTLPVAVPKEGDGK